MRLFKYLKYLYIHKYYVAKFCFENKLYWRGLVHDWSKFLPSEFIPYMNFFYGKNGAINIGRMKAGYHKPFQSSEDKYDLAWLKHQKRNKHHWQWWVLPGDDGTLQALPMKKQYLMEMICDWRAVGIAQGVGDNTKKWYLKNKDKIVLHTETRKQVETILTDLYGKLEIDVITRPPARETLERVNK